ncbi:MAG: 3-dehydroquinate synthase [Butyricicoccus sp.]
MTHTVIPAGEEHKQLSTVEGIYHDLLAADMTRKDLIIALGGGVVGDITGFAAATFLRGVSLCQIPTTLLAQVDSSVGGKTGVDLPEGKNLVGAFYQPRLVLIDPNVLASLPDSTFADGMAEVVKYGYISNREILTMVSQPDYKSNIENIIYECVKIKRDVVAIDEHDTGLRMILNFGHTIGHAAEKLGNYTDLTHGQAVAIGMVAAMRLSALLGNEDLTAPLIDNLKHIGLPTELNYDRESIFNALLSDKKKFGATVNFILVREAGRAEITPIDAEKLHEYVLKL